MPGEAHLQYQGRAYSARRITFAVPGKVVQCQESHTSIVPVCVMNNVGVCWQLSIAIHFVLENMQKQDARA